jgi:hypothetical protein
MKRLSPNVFTGGSIRGVAQDWKLFIAAVHSNLMGASGHNSELKERERVFKILLYGVMSGGVSRSNTVYTHFMAVDWVSTNRE